MPTTRMTFMDFTRAVNNAMRMQIGVGYTDLISPNMTPALDPDRVKLNRAWAGGYAPEQFVDAFVDGYGFTRITQRNIDRVDQIAELNMARAALAQFVLADRETKREAGEEWYLATDGSVLNKRAEGVFRVRAEMLANGSSGFVTYRHIDPTIDLTSAGDDFLQRVKPIDDSGFVRIATGFDLRDADQAVQTMAPRFGPDAGPQAAPAM